MERNQSLDLLKIILAIFIVGLHTAFLKDRSVLFSFILGNGFFRIAVPIFLIISGYYFSKINSLKNLYKWGKRIILLYATWMIIYSPFWYHGFQLLTFYNILNGYFVLWYLPHTFLGGLMLYALRKRSDKFLLIISFFIFLIGYIFQQVGNIHYFTGKLDAYLNYTPYHRNFLFVCFPFLAIGYVLKRNDNLIHSFKNNIVVLICIAVLLLEASFNYFLINRNEPYDQLISLFFVCPMIFLYAKNIEIKTNFKNLPLISSGIFLSHPLFYVLFKKELITMNTLFFIVVTILSLITSMLLIKIKKKYDYIL